MSLGELFDGVARKIEIDFEKLTGLPSHPGIVGTCRENVLKDFLSAYLPSRFRIESGIVIDALGGRSKQMDVVIYEANYTPVFEIAGRQRFYPCETVVAVGQVKTDVGSRAVMQECLDNISSAKRLDRSNNGTNQIITGPGISLPLAGGFDPNKQYKDQIFGFIFCLSSINKDLMITELKEFNKKNERKLWTNLILDYKRFLIEYEENEGHLSQNTMKAGKFALLERNSTGQILALFISILNNFLNEAHIARPNHFAYHKTDPAEHQNYELAPDGENSTP